MQFHASSFTKRSLFLGLGITVLLASLAATCRQQHGSKDIDITSKTTYSGMINGSPIKVDVLATINTGRGGSSACTFVSLPPSFNPAVLGTMAWTSHHTSTGLGRFQNDPKVMNLYDLTKGNYSVVRTISYPDFPGSQIVTNAVVKATSDREWDTNISINGTYNGPTDVVSVKDYQLVWTSDGKSIIESGSATLGLKSGGSIRQVWKSTITPAGGIEKFPPSGELITVSISDFQINGNKMSYNWEGTVKAQSK